MREVKYAVFWACVLYCAFSLTFLFIAVSSILEPYYVYHYKANKYITFTTAANIQYKYTAWTSIKECVF